MLRYLMLVSLVFIAATPRSETAQESSVPEDKASFSGATILALHNGLNRIDLLGDGKQGIVFVARRENFNPHGHSSITFYIRASASSAFFSMPVAWHIVPFFGQTEEDYTELLQTVQGADCTLADLRLIRTHRSGPASVIFAHRQLGEGYGGAESVQFDVYRLKENQERESGRPLYYFELEHTIRPKPPYCDVNEAFATELGLGNAGH